MEVKAGLTLRLPAASKPRAGFTTPSMCIYKPAADSVRPCMFAVGAVCMLVGDGRAGPPGGQQLWRRKEGEGRQGEGCYLLAHKCFEVRVEKHSETVRPRPEVPPPPSGVCTAIAQQMLR